MAQVTLVDQDQAPLRSRAFYAKGDPGPIVKSMAHVPELLETAMPFIGTIYGDSAVDMRLKEIVVLRTSALMRCNYCVKTHTVVARDAGLSRDEVVALRDSAQPANGLFGNEREKALVAWVDALASGPEPIAADVLEAMRAQFSEPEIVELTLLGGTTLMLNRYCTALDLPPSPKTVERLQAEDLA